MRGASCGDPPTADTIEPWTDVRRLGGLGTRRRFRGCCCARHHPSARKRDPDCLASASQGLPPLSYLRHSPSLKRFNHRATPRAAPATTPAASDLPRLEMIVEHWFTSLGDSSYVRAPAAP